MDPHQHAALSASANANSFVGPEELEDSGLEASFDAEAFVLTLSAIS